MSKGPCPLTARCGIGRLCGERKRRKRCERPCGARNAACGRQRRIPQELCSPRPVRSPAARARSCRGRRVPAPTARAVRPHQPRNPHRASVSSVQRRKKRASPHPAAHPAAPCPPPRQNPRRARPLLPRQARPRAPRPRRAPAPAPQPAPRKRFERPQGARNASPRTATLTTPEPTFPHPPSGGSEGSRALRAAFRIQRHARWIRQPCASKATLRRPPPGEVNGAAVDEVGGRRTPGGKDRRQPSFSDALYSIIASASLTSSIRRATCAGVSTGWLNSTVWFTVTAGVAGDCAACAVRRPS